MTPDWAEVLGRARIGSFTEFRPLLVDVLGAGLPPRVARTLGIDGVQEIGGGMKAELVALARLRLDLFLKVGGPELSADKRLMDAVNARAPGTLCTAITITELSNGKHMLLMEAIGSAEPLLDTVIERDLSTSQLDRLASKAVRRVRDVHRTPGVALPSTQDPFSTRLRGKLDAVARHLPAAALLRTAPGVVDGRPCPPADTLVDAAERWLAGPGKPRELALCHGDPHAANVLVGRWSTGHRVVLIDPNAAVGHTDPLYDAGKLLHWTGTLGLVKYDERLATGARFDVSGDGWDLAIPEDLHARLRSQKGAERLRHLDRALRRRLRPMRQGRPEAALDLAEAAAHVGMAPLLAKKGKGPQLAVALHETLRALRAWAEGVGAA